MKKIKWFECGICRKTKSIKLGEAVDPNTGHLICYACTKLKTKK